VASKTSSVAGTEVKACQTRLLLGWMTTKEDQSLSAWIRSLVWTESVIDRLYSRYCAEVNVKLFNQTIYVLSSRIYKYRKEHDSC